MTEFDSRAYTEVYEIINMLSEQERTKIPQKWHEVIEVKRDKNYKFDPREEDLELLSDTEKILSVLYTDYLATEKERKIIQAKEKAYTRKNMASTSVIEGEKMTEDTYEIKEMTKNEKNFLERCLGHIKMFFGFGKK